MQLTLVFLLCGLAVRAASGSHSTYCVKSDNSAPHSPHPCETLEFYASNASEYFTDNTSFIFLPGTHVLSNISIYNVSNVVLMASAEQDEGNVTLQCNGSGGLVFQHASNVVLANLSFVSCGQPLPLSLQREGETAQAALAFGEVTDLLLESLSVSHSRGFGVLGHCVHGYFTINNSFLSTNNGSKWYLGGNAAIEYTNCTQPEKGTSNNLHISSSSFTNGNYDGYLYSNSTYRLTLATGLLLILSQTNTTVLIVDVLMQGNRNNIIRGIGGNLFIHFYNETNFTSNDVTIKNSRFLYGVGQIGAGIGATFYTPSKVKTTNHSLCYNSLVIRNTEISQNLGIVGSGLYYEFQMEHSNTVCPYANFVMSNCTLDNNSIVIPYQNPFHFTSNGIALQVVAKYHKNLIAEKIPNHYQLLFENCCFMNSHLINSTKGNSGTLLVLPNVMTVLIENTDKSIKFRDCQISDNMFAGLGIFNSLIELDGKMDIINNTGTNGGGIMLCESSFIYPGSEATIHIMNNHASQAGGGIYVEKQCFGSRPFCFFQHNWHCDDTLRTQIMMINNTAGYAGDHIYGGSLDNCKISDCNSTEAFKTLFKISPNSCRAVTSSPRSTCLCIEESPKCGTRSYNYPWSVYPGESIKVQVSIFGQLQGIVPGTLVVYSKQNQQVLTRTIKERCQTLAIKIMGSTGSDSEDLILQMSTAQEPINNTVYLSVNDALYIHIPIKLCPWGFSHSNGICGCDKVLPKRVECNISTNTIFMPPPAWIGFSNETGAKGIIYHDLCPYGYCLNEDTNVTSNGEIFDQDAQCAPKRTGFLCSKCVYGFSLSHGSSDCVQCKNKVGVPTTILGYGLIGILLIVLLLVVNITITDGTISGLLLYSNIINLNHNTFLPSSNQNVLTFIISWINLSTGYNSSCFYHGMDSYAKAWMSFIFPIYLFAITAAMVFLVRKSSKVARLVGGNVTKVLATLFLLSYTKLIQSVVTVLSFTLIQYPPSSNTTDKGVNKIVWLPDPTLEYFSGKHIPLALVAIVFGLLILAFTMVLLCVQPLQRYSHLRCFSWMAKLKPLIDAYTAPHIIKDNCRYWEGLLLFFRLVLAVVFSFNNFSNGKLNHNLYPLSLLCVLLLTISWSTGGIYKKFNLNILNLTSILNLCILALLVSSTKDSDVKYTYQLSFKFATVRSFRILTYSSFAVQVILLVIVLFYHTYVCVLSWHLRYKRFKYETLGGDSNEHLPCTTAPISTGKLSLHCNSSSIRIPVVSSSTCCV